MSVWQEPVRGVSGHPSITRLSGVELMRGYMGGMLPGPPVGHLTGLRPTDAGLTHATFTLPVTRWLLDVSGSLMPATAALVSDAPLSSAFANSLPLGKVCTTSELSISYLRPAGLEAERLIAQAAVIKAGASTGLTEARITDAGGRLLAHATSRLVVLDVPVDRDTPFPEPDAPPATPDPWQRESTGEITEWETLAGLTGRQMFERWLDGSLPAPPISHLTGLMPAGCDEDTVTWRMPTSPWLGSPGPFLYGGATALIADAALTTAVMPGLEPGVAFRPLDIRLRYIRPVLAGSGDLVATARVIHRGRTLAIAQCEVHTADGKVAILGESSILLRPTGS